MLLYYIPHLYFVCNHLIFLLMYKQESRMAYGTADEVLLTVLVIFKEMFLYKDDNN